MSNSIVAKYNQWRRYRRTFNQLNALSDRELFDLGISRFELNSVARKASR